LQSTLHDRSAALFELRNGARPDVKVVLTSAYGEEIAKTTTSAIQTCSFIRKPFQLGVLVQTLQNVLRAGGTSEVVRRDEL
jgi:DNA-binding response OmpR family regulator